MPSSTTFLAVIEVTPDDRVLCSAEGCGHSVYKRVHLVRVDGRTRVYGADCFSRLFGHTDIGRSHPRYGSSQGRALTPEERNLLKSNTEQLIDAFESEHQDELACADASQPAVERCAIDVHNSGTNQRPLFGERHASAGTRSAAEAVARERLAKRYPGVNINLPGYIGLVSMEIEAVVREMVA